MSSFIFNDNYKKIIYFDRYLVTKINIFNYPIKSFKFVNNIEKNEYLCQDQVNFTYLMNNCYKRNGSKELIYLFGDSRAWHIKNIFSDTSEDYIHHYLANSAFDYPFFDEKNNSSKIVLENLENLSKNYEKITLVTSFFHNLSRERYEKRYNKKDYFKVQLNNYLYLIKNLPSNVHLSFLLDTPTPPLTYKDCLNEKFIKFEILTKSNKILNCDYSYTQFKKKNYEVKNLLMKISEINKVNLISINDLICKNETCSFFYKNYPIIYDRFHFNKKYMEENKDKIIKKILRKK